jgi:hypothetical protein
MYTSSHSSCDFLFISTACAQIHNTTGNVRIALTLRRVPVTIIAMEKAITNTYSECVCSLRYSAWNAHAPYCPLWPAPLYNIFPHYEIMWKNEMTRFKKKGIEHNLFWFSLQFIWNTNHSKKKWARYNKKIYFNCCLSVHVDNYTIIVPTKCTSLLKAQDITICTVCLCILSPYMFQPAWVIFRGRNVSA